MKKLLLLSVTLFFLSLTVFAQTTLLTEDWETAAVGQTPPTGWGIDLVSGTNYLYFQSAGTFPTCTPFSGSRFVEFDSFDATSGTSNRLKRTTALMITMTIINNSRFFDDVFFSMLFIINLP